MKITSNTVLGLCIRLCGSNLLLIWILSIYHAADMISWRQTVITVPTSFSHPLDPQPLGVAYKFMVECLYCLSWLKRLDLNWVPWRASLVIHLQRWQCHYSWGVHINSRLAVRCSVYSLLSYQKKPVMVVWFLTVSHFFEDLEDFQAIRDKRLRT